MTWTVYTGAVAYTIETIDTAGLAAAIHRRYRGSIRRAYEVRLNLGDDLQPTGKGVVLATDTGELLDRLRVVRVGEHRRAS